MLFQFFDAIFDRVVEDKRQAGTIDLGVADIYGCNKQLLKSDELISVDGMRRPQLKSTCEE